MKGIEMLEQLEQEEVKNRRMKKRDYEDEGRIRVASPKDERKIGITGHQKEGGVPEMSGADGTAIG